MIAFLSGRVAAKEIGSVLVEVGGVGYRLSMSTSSLAALPAVGDEVLVWTHLHVRDDGIALFGFENEDERLAFEQLIGVTGIGPKVALAMLSALSPDALAAAVATEDVATISTVPGVGKKTAQRLILELKDKLGAGEGFSAGSRPQSAGAALAEANDALLAMGFAPAEASSALKGYDGDASDAQSVLAYALKRLGSAR
jgi:holliday junction DNA helicase RuvA